MAIDGRIDRLHRPSRLLLTLAALSTPAVVRSESADEVKERLLDGYPHRTTPPSLAVVQEQPGSTTGSCSAAAPTYVQTQLYIDRLHPLGEMKQIYGFEGYLRLWWVDPRLAFNASCGPASLSELSLTRAEAQRIWRPDLYWEDAIEVVLPDLVMGVKDGAGEMFTVASDGGVFWSRQAKFTLSCPMSLDTLPFDTQRCNYTVGLYSQRADAVHLSWKPGTVAMAGWHDSCLSSWVATALEARSVEKVYSSGTYTYAEATLDFTRIPDKCALQPPLRALLRMLTHIAHCALPAGLAVRLHILLRHPSAWMAPPPARYVLNYMLQSIVMVIISWLGFLIDPTATPARVALGITGWSKWPSWREHIGPSRVPQTVSKGLRLL